MRARFCFPALLIDLLHKGRTTKIVNAGFSQLLQVLAALVFCQQYSGAVFANILEDRLDVFEVSDVETGKRESDMTKMAGA